ncbi:MAG: hypothetical protein HQ513_14495 [Rhodospirillales bacterium]|nr:hypothetical protein [Rhodospirillales bacterium]
MSARQVHRVLKKNQESLPALTVPIMGLDFLFLILLVSFLEWGNPYQPVLSHDVKIPTADRDDGKKPVAPLALRPIQSDGVWFYTAPDGKRLTAGEAAARVRAEKKTPVLIIDKTSSIQTYLDAQQQLRAQGLKDIGLAARSNPIGESHANH